MAEVKISSKSGIPVRVSVKVEYPDGSVETLGETDRKVVIEAEIDSIQVEGDVLGDLTVGECSNGNGRREVTCGNVGGKVAAGDSVTCGEVAGGVEAGDSVTCGKVAGDVEAGDSVICGDVLGKVEAGADFGENYHGFRSKITTHSERSDAGCLIIVKW